MRFSRFVIVPGAEVEKYTDDVLWLIEHQWRVQRPGALISISGGMKTDDVNPFLAQILARGLKAAVDQTDGWVISSGVNSGVNRLFGTGLNGGTAPLFGIPAWAAVAPDIRSKLIRAVTMGVPAKMTAQPLNQPIRRSNTGEYLLGPAAAEAADLSNSATHLEPHHSHFIIVDKDPKNPDQHFYAAARLRKELEERMHSSWGVPQLLLCLGSFDSGRLNTLRFITGKLKSGVPVLFVRETKGVAGLVSRFMETLRPSTQALPRECIPSRPKAVGRHIRQIDARTLRLRYFSHTVARHLPVLQTAVFRL